MLLRRHLVTEREFNESFSWFRGVRGRVVLDLAMRCKWVAVDTGRHLVVTERGSRIAAGRDPRERLRLQLFDIVLASRPSWRALVRRGRRVVERYTDVDTQQCLEEAGLFTNDEDAVKWWDGLLGAIGGEIGQLANLEVGREGEGLSLELEARRTGVAPVWMAIEDSFAGYDILSQVARGDSRSLMIEVKTSTQFWERALFDITSNEWETLRAAENAVLHLWSLAYRPPKHFTLTIAALEGHVPRNSGKGFWRITRIPFQIE